MKKALANMTSIRARIISVIVLSTLFIIVFSVSAGIMYVRNTVKTSQESEMALVAQTADLFLSSEIRHLKEQAVNAAYRLAISDGENWHGVMEQLHMTYPEFIGMTIFDETDGILAFSGKLPASADIKDDEYIQQALAGKVVISSSIPVSAAEDGQNQVVFYLAAPIPEASGRILILTLPELFLADRLSEIDVWGAGHIFVDDREGTIIANRNTGWIQNRQNFIKLAETDSAHEQMASVLRRPANGETGTGYFAVSGVGIIRLCAFRPIRGSDEGWFLGAVAPLPNSPFKDVENGLMVVGLVSLFLSIIAAVVASGFINKLSVRMSKALEHHGNLLDAVSKTAGVLLTTKEETFEDSLMYGMETLGRSVDADRVRIMKNELIDGELFFVYQYEWVSDSVNKGRSPKETMFPYTIIAEWQDLFSQGECISGSLSSVPPGIQNYFNRIQTKSALVIPIFIDGGFWGLISFLDCERERTFTDDEVNILRSGALMMGSAINRRAQTSEIREGHNRATLLLDSMPYACHLWNRDLEIFDCNEANVRLFNLNNKTEVMECFFRFSPEYQPDGRLSSEVAGEMLKKAFDHGKLVGEYMHKTSDGAPLPVEMTLARVAYGNDYVVAAYARDLREYKMMIGEMIALQERLKEENINMLKQFEMIWSKVDSGMVIIDAETRTLLDANPTACRMYGGDIAEMTGETCFKFFGQHECPILDAGQTIDRGERKFIKSDGTVIPILKSISKILYNGRPAFLECFTDISYLKAVDEQKRRVEVAEQANNTKSEFLANISHEMRTPLNAVLGLSGLTLEMEGLNEETIGNLEKIYSAGSTLLSIVNDILDISKIEAGKIELIPNEYDIPSMINDIISQNILRIGSKLIDFTLDISADIPAVLYGDDLRIKQILNNLLSNAFKYTQEGKVELGICSEHQEEDEIVWVTAWVKDTGMGIRHEDIDKLFSDYSQVDTKANRKIEGTGLGLAIAKKMVELMDGTISVESEYGKGSVFTVRFKQKFVTGKVIGEDVVHNLMRYKYSDAKRKQSLQIMRIKMPYARVLVVDDNLTNLDVAKGLMKPYGMQIDCVTNGADAIASIRAGKYKYDAVFMDHMMPGMDGLEATRRIREIETDYARNIPIIALTANAITGNAEKFLNSGFQDFLSKPVDLPHLDEVLRRWVRDKTKENGLPAEETNAGTDLAGSDRLTDIKIPGLNVQKGVERFRNDAQAYLSILRSYKINTLPVLERIRAVDKTNLADYATDVHGIKGSSRGIFANGIGDLAEKLENAAKAGDIAFVNINNARLLETTEKLLADIEDTLSAIDAENPKEKKDMIDREVLLQLISACEGYDIDGINKAMKALDAYEYDCNGGLAAWLKDNILDGNLDEIAEKLSKMIEQEGT